MIPLNRNLVPHKTLAKLDYSGETYHEIRAMIDEIKGELHKNNSL